MLLTVYLRKHLILAQISERMRLRRRRFGRYEVLDFLAVLLGYAISGERTLEAFYERLWPFAVPFMACFEREQLPSRSALSRFLVCDEAAEECPFSPGARHQEHWGFPDPSKASGTEDERLAVFRQVRNAIAARIERWLREKAEVR